MKNGRPMAMSYCTKEAKLYRKNFSEYVATQVVQQGWSLVPNSTQHFYVDAIFYFPRLDLDPNNAFKILLDAITDTQLIWLDDNVACERVQGIYYDSSNPRIELTIHPVDYIGVFNNHDLHTEFVGRCKTCSRYSRNCSTLAKAEQGRIQSSITLCNGAYRCAEFKEAKNGKNKQDHSKENN